MASWTGTFMVVQRERFRWLVAYGVLLTGARDSGRELAQDALTAVFSRSRTPKTIAAAELAIHREMAANAGAEVGAPAVAEGPHATIRSRLASLPSAQRAATVQWALDGVGAVEPAHEEWRAQIVAWYAAEADTYAVPAGGVGTLLLTARRSHKGSLARSAALVAGCVVGGFVLVSAGIAFLPKLSFGTNAAGPAASPSVSPSAVGVAWDPAAALATVPNAEDLPECGSEYIPEPTTVSGIESQLRMPWGLDEGQGPYIGLNVSLIGTQEGAKDFLALPTRLVVTKDNVVVLVATGDANDIELVGSVLRPLWANFSLEQSCAAQADWDENLSAYDDLDWDLLSESEQAFAAERIREFRDKWSLLGPGTYRIYGVTPVMFGEQLAVAQHISIEGNLEYLAYIREGIGFTDFVKDSRILPYCQLLEDSPGDYQCDVPDDVLAEVLSAQVDPDSVVDIEGGVVISEPLEVVIEEELDLSYPDE